MTTACAALPAQTHRTAVAAAPTLQDRRAPECSIRLGPCDVTVRGAYAQAIADFAHLYADRAIDEPFRADRIELDIRRQPGPFGRARFAIRCGAETIFADLRAGEVLPYLEWAVNYRFIATCRDHLLLHAATVSWQGQGIILVGNSGSGKSTLAAAIAARGGRYLCDEFAVIDLADLQIHPFPRALCVKAGSFALMRAVGLPLWRRRCHVKAFKGCVGYVRPADLNPADQPHPVHAVIFPRFTGGGTPALHDIPLSQAAFVLAAGALNTPDHPRSTADAMAQLAAQSTCRVLEVGDIHATVEQVERLLSDRSACQLAAAPLPA